MQSSVIAPCSHTRNGIAMPNPAQFVSGTMTRPKKRVFTVLATSFLLVAGLTAYLVHNAPPAHAATQITGGLSVSVNPNSTTVDIGTVSTTVTYTCTDTTVPDVQAQLRVDFDQNGNDTSGEVDVPCGTTDLSQTRTVTAAQVGMDGSQLVTAIATLDDGTSAVSDTVDTITDGVYVYNDPTVTYPGDGTVTLTGFYNCGPTIATPGKLIITASEVDSSDVATAGSALVTITTCDGTDQPWSVNIAGSLSGDEYGPDCEDTVSKPVGTKCITIVGTPDYTLVAVVGVTHGTSISQFA
jgi:hypothetical protein